MTLPDLARDAPLQCSPLDAASLRAPAAPTHHLVSLSSSPWTYRSGLAAATAPSHGTAFTVTSFAAAAMCTFVRQEGLFVTFTVDEQLIFHPKVFAWVPFLRERTMSPPSHAAGCACDIQGIVWSSPPQAVHSSPEKFRGAKTVPLVSTTPSHASDRRGFRLEGLPYGAWGGPVGAADPH